MSIAFSNIYGNDRLKEIFAKGISDNTLPHALILEGGKGSGKNTFALNIAAASLCTDISKPCGVCKNCRQVFSSVAPDVHTVALPEDKANIPVESVRFIRSDANNVPVEGDVKFYIIKDSERMTVQAQNALLKILEEPPRFVIFILLCENANLLLPTIRSRAPVFRMQRFEEDELSQYIRSSVKEGDKLYSNDPAAFIRVIKAANGSIGNALDSLDKRSVGRFNKENEFLTGFFTALSKVNKADFYRYEDELSSKRDEFKETLVLLRCGLRDIISCKKATSATLVCFDSEADVKKLSKTFTVYALVQMLEITEKALSMNELNSNVNLLKINYMSEMWKSAH